jgi:hypothetical protein
MSQRQLETCAERLPPGERERFMSLQREAMSLISEGVRLRQAAWRMYRERVLESVGELAATGATATEIAKRLGLSVATIHKMLRAAARDRYG